MLKFSGEATSPSGSLYKQRSGTSLRRSVSIPASERSLRSQTSSEYRKVIPANGPFSFLAVLASLLPSSTVKQITAGEIYKPKKEENLKEFKGIAGKKPFTKLENPSEWSIPYIAGDEGKPVYLFVPGAGSGIKELSELAAQKAKDGFTVVMDPQVFKPENWDKTHLRPDALNKEPSRRSTNMQEKFIRFLKKPEFQDRDIQVVTHSAGLGKVLNALMTYKDRPFLKKPLRILGLAAPPILSKTHQNILSVEGKPDIITSRLGASGQMLPNGYNLPKAQEVAKAYPDMELTVVSAEHDHLVRGALSRWAKPVKRFKHLVVKNAFHESIASSDPNFHSNSHRQKKTKTQAEKLGRRSKGSSPLSQVLGILKKR